MALLAAVVVSAGLPASDRVQAVGAAGTVWTRAGSAAQRIDSVAQPIEALPAAADVGVDATPPAPSPDVTTTATAATAAPSATATATSTNTPRPTRTPTPHPTRTPTPLPTDTPTETPTPSPTSTPTAIPTPSVQMLSVGVYTFAKGREKRVTSAALGTPIRLKIIVTVANAPSAGAHVLANWALRGAVGTRTYMSYSRDFHLHDGSIGLYYDVVLPERNFAVGGYLFVGTVTFHGVAQEKATRLHVSGAVVSTVQMRVHYAHLRITVPAHWHLDFSNNNGRPATGKDTLFMISDSRRALVAIISLTLSKAPSAADLHAFPPELLRQEFPDGTSNIKTIFFKDQIDGHDVFAAQADVKIGGATSRMSGAIAIATNKKREFYAFTVVNYFKQALPSEQHAALAAIFGAKLD